MQSDVSRESAGGQAPPSTVDEVGLALLCRVHAYWCALPLRHVVETMRPLPTSPIAGAPSFVAGVAIIRGAPVPVVALSRLLGATGAEPRRFVCVRTERGVVALAVDDVRGVRSLAGQSLRALPSLLQHAEPHMVTAVGTLDAELLLVIQTARAVPDELWDAVDSQAASV